MLGVVRGVQRNPESLIGVCTVAASSKVCRIQQVVRPVRSWIQLRDEPIANGIGETCLKGAQCIVPGKLLELVVPVT